jgi:hypothetical protein
MRGIRVLGIMSLGLTASACSGNVKPGDRDYPVINNTQITNVDVVGQVPKEWDLHIFATFVPNAGQLSCSYTVGLGRRPIGVAITCTTEDNRQSVWSIEFDAGRQLAWDVGKMDAALRLGG